MKKGIDVELDKRRILESMSTRHLLSWLRMTYIYGGVFDPTYCSGDPYTTDEIKAILAGREHIPNKQEGEVLRKARQKTRREARNGIFVRRR